MRNRDHRFILCRPQAGLTDIISRIGNCVRYGDRFNRFVIVDTNFGGAVHFRDEFSNYFVSHDNDLILTSKDHVAQFDHLATYPHSFTGRINSYRASYDNSKSAYADLETGEITNFDFTKNYSEPLLLSHASGGGMRKAKIALRRLSLSELLRKEVELRLARIGGVYSSIHIRNSDFTTDYEAHVKELQQRNSGLIYVATDNLKALNFCRELFGANRVFNFSTLPQDAGNPIHSNTLLDARAHNIDAICDLILLASAKTYYFFPLSNPHLTGAKYSGYSKLAEALHNDKVLLRQFIRADAFGTVARMRLKMRKVLYRGLGLVSTLMPFIRSAN